MSGGSFGDEAAIVSEVDVFFFADTGEVEFGGVAEARESIAATPTVGVESGDRLGSELVVLDIASDAQRGVGGLGLSAGDKESLEAFG